MASSVINSVRDLLPLLRNSAPSTESGRAISEDGMRDLAATGFFAMYRTKIYGGEEAHPVEYVTAVRMIASACGSTGWAASLLGISAWHVALLRPQAQEDVWGRDPTVLVAPGYAPQGRLVPTGDGYRLNGNWRSVPAVDHCGWVLLGSLLIGESGDPVDFVTVLVPRDQLELGDPWDVVGLRGTGSRTVVAKDVLVPLHRTYASVDRQRNSTTKVNPDLAPVHRLPHGSIHSTAITAPVLGIVEGSYRYHLARERKKNQLSLGGRKPSEDNLAYMAVSRGSGELDASVLQIERDLGEQMEHTTRSEAISMELRLRSRRNQVLCTERAVAAMDTLFQVSGGHAAQMDGPIQRAWRDAHTAAAHRVNQPDHALEIYGRWAHGLGVDDSLILM